MPPCGFGRRLSRRLPQDRRKLGALECEFRTKREGFADTRAVGCEALASLSQPMPIILLLALEMRERMLEARDGAERRDGHRKLDLEHRARPLKHGRVGTPQALTFEYKVEAAD